MTQKVEQLNTFFGSGSAAFFTAGRGGLPCLQVKTPVAEAELYLHGAQVTSWKPAGHEEVLFVSRESRWEAGKAIRGGIPICFPWFRNKSDDSKAPAHGFARTQSRELLSVTQEEGGITAELTLQSAEASLRWWLHSFQATFRVHFGAQLTAGITVLNTGTAPFSFEEALHTYLRVGDAAQVRVKGLDGVTYLDNVDNNLRRQQHGDVVLAGPTDNAYMETHSTLLVEDRELGRTLRVGKHGSRTTVVWNPWESGAKALGDLGDEEWRAMACVEASNILSGAVALEAGQSHTMETTVSIVE